MYFPIAKENFFEWQMFRNFSRRLGGRPLQTKHIVRNFESFEEALEFFQTKINLSVIQLEPILSQLAFIQSRNRICSTDSLFKDERFTQMILQATADMANSDSETLSRFAQAISKLDLPIGGSPELTELARKIAEVSSRRPNAFSPSSLSALAFGLSSRGVSDPQFSEFVRMESLKMMQDFSPENAIMILEAFRRMGSFNRELVDNIVERLTDEVDRFTTRDIVNCVSVFVKLGLGRGFLLRRLSKLSFENLSLFKQTQLIRLLSGLAQLRFLTQSGVDALLNAIESQGIDKISPSQGCDVLFAAAMVNYEGSSQVLSCMIEKASARPDEISITNAIDAAWALCCFNKEKELGPLVKKIFEIQPPSNRQLLLKSLEIANYVKLETTTFPKDMISPQWLGAMDDAEKQETNRFESARLHSEILALVESLPPKGLIHEKLAIQRSAQVGGYRVDMYDENHRLLIDIDTLARPTRLVLRHRHLSSQGFKVVELGYWEGRRFKTYEEQQEWLKVKIGKALKSS
jgi:very-short-patch-repair endonuclease